MAYIRKISFDTVSEHRGCTCDRCGQGIKNIWTVEYVEGFKMHYGIDCFDKVCKQGLSKQGQKEMKKIMKSIEHYKERLMVYTSGEMTEETDMDYKAEQMDEHSAWYGESYEAYKNWIVNELLPYRISRCQKDLEKFKNINFEA